MITNMGNFNRLTENPGRISRSMQSPAPAEEISWSQGNNVMNFMGNAGTNGVWIPGTDSKNVLSVSGRGSMDFRPSAPNRRNMEVFFFRPGFDVDIHGQILVTSLAIQIFQFRLAF